MRPLLLALAAVPLLAGCGSSASPAARLSPGAAPTALPSSLPVATPVRRPNASMTSAGMDLPTGPLAFGTLVSDVRPAVIAALGPPDEQGPVDPLTSECSGQGLSILGYGDGALRLYFDTSARDAFTGWVLAGEAADDSVPTASALVDGAPFSFGPGTTVAALQQGLGEALTLTELDEGGPFLSYVDEAGLITGFLDAIEPDGSVGVLQGGGGCDA